MQPNRKSKKNRCRMRKILFEDALQSDGFGILLEFFQNAAAICSEFEIGCLPNHVVSTTK